MERGATWRASGQVWRGLAGLADTRVVDTASSASLGRKLGTVTLLQPYAVALLTGAAAVLFNTAFPPFSTVNYGVRPIGAIVGGVLAPSSDSEPP